MKKFVYRRMAPALPALFVVLLLAASACAEKWSFTAIADCHSEFAGFKTVLEQIKSNRPSDPDFPPTRFVVGVGDLSPLPVNYKIFNDIMGSGVPLVPIRGNHESAADVRFALDRILPALRFGIELHEPGGTTYYFDYENARFISIDLYTEHGRGPRDPALLEWVERAIRSATNAEHVFIAFHEPHFSFLPKLDPFWRLLLRNSDKVRAVFSGHTHRYSRRFVSGERAGVHSIGVGNAGRMRHSDQKLTFVQVSVDGKDVLFRAVQAPAGTRDFTVSERWSATEAGE